LSLQQQWPISDISFLGDLSLDYDSSQSVNQLQPSGLIITVYRHHFSPKWQYFTNLLAQVNQGFLSPTTDDNDTAWSAEVVLGGGYTLWRGKTPQSFLDLQVGVGDRYDYDELRSANQFSSQGVPTLWVALWSRGIPVGGSTIDQALAFSPALTNFNDFEIVSRTKLTVPLTAKLSLNNTLQLFYRNERILITNPNWNIVFSTGLGHDF
jgi:hypothetical protein